VLTHDGYVDEFNCFSWKIQCKGGGGGSSGKVDFPDHMKVAHKDWLDGTGVDKMTSSIVDLMNAAMAGASPYSGYVPVDPDTVFFAAGNTAVNYRTPYELLSCFDKWSTDTAFATYMADDAAYITAAIDAHSSILDNEINNNVLPAFKAGMANINATMSSAFVVGAAKIWDSKVAKVAETDANIRLTRLQQGAEVALNRIGALTQWRQIVTQMSAELARIYLVASAERDDDYLEALHKDATWDMEMYQYGTQVMASISGTAAQTVPRKSKTGSAIGGAMSGGAMGAMIAGGMKGGMSGNPMMIAGGAALGLAAALL